MVDFIRNEFVEEVTTVIRAGKKGEPQTLTAGGTQASGSIDYGVVLQVEGDTDVINGVYVKYTAAASDATAAGTALDPLLVNIKVSITLTIDEAVVVLNAATHASLIVATYSNVGGTALTATYDTNGVAGNLFTLVADVGTASGATLTGGQDNRSLSLNTDSHDLALTQAVDQDFLLADGVEFQRKTIYASAKGAGDAVLTPTNLTGGTTLTYGTAGMYSDLVFLGGSWVVVASTATLA